MVKYILLINSFLLKNLSVNLFMCLHLETNSARVSPLIYELESTAHKESQQRKIIIYSQAIKPPAIYHQANSSHG